MFVSSSRQPASPSPRLAYGGAIASSGCGDGGAPPPSRVSSAACFASVAFSMSIVLSVGSKAINLVPCLGIVVQKSLNHAHIARQQ